MFNSLIFIVMKTSTFLAFMFFAILALVAIGIESQAQGTVIDNPYASATLQGDRATITLKDVSVTRAINDLVDVSCKGKQTSVVVVDTDGDDAWSIVWYAEKEQYEVVNYDELIQVCDNLTDAKKALKKAMKDYYAQYGVLCFMEHK